MKNNDWKSALSSLLPEDYAPENAPEAHEVEAKQSGPLRIELDRKRAGKIATIVSGFTLPEEQIAGIARQIKQKLGAGGSHRAGEILIQGDRREALDTFLRSLGYKTRLI